MKKIAAILVGLLVIVFVTLLVFQEDSSDTSVRNDVTQDESEPLSQTSCTASGGSWNFCGSACRTTPESPCIEVCVAYCECSSDAQCPTGLTCKDFVNDVGVCL